MHDIIFLDYNSIVACAFMNCILLLKSQENFEDLEMKATTSQFFNYNPIVNILNYTESIDDSQVELEESSECWDEILDSYSFFV